LSSEERTKELIKGLHDAVVNMDEHAVAELSQAVLKEGVDAHDAVTHGLAAAMDKVGELYIEQEYYVPELLLCSDALYAGLHILQPYIKVEGVQQKKQIVLGVVEGDFHDIGKNLVKIMFEVSGWTVHDLGSDVKLERFLEEQQKTNSDIVGMSALLTSTMLAMPVAIRMIKEQDPDVPVIVGGAPLTREIAKNYGADGYANNAVEAVEEATRVIDRLQESRQSPSP
jgi:methanogenic corrinoid protein MtbC1